MKCNIKTVLIGPNVVLVPYAASHVPKYNEWMSNAELRELTASEPLTLEEEYEMQEKWQVDEDKLTFIILSREGGVNFGRNEAVDPADDRLKQCPMAGDVNLFLTGGLEKLQRPLLDANDEEEDEDAYAEVEIMIAEPSYRRKGYAVEALRLMLGYATGCDVVESTPGSDTRPHIESPLMISPTRLLTRISESNTPSRRLFERLGFQVTKHVAVFQEVEMRWKGHVGKLGSQTPASESSPILCP